MRGFLFVAPSLRIRKPRPFTERGDVNSQLRSLKIIT